MEAFGKFCYGLILFTISIVVGGYVFMVMWNWFIVDIFSMKNLSLLESTGIVTFINYLKPTTTKSNDEDNRLTIKKITIGIGVKIVLGGFTLLLGYIILLFK